MATPSVTLRSLRNQNTGIDISVPSIHEEEAPLGGTSILYEISVCTTLEIFKTKLHKAEDVVYFSIFKAYREVEDFYTKIKKKVPGSNLPVIHSSASKQEISQDEKMSQLDVLMKSIAQNVEICKCSIFTQFIGLNLQKQSSTVLSKEEDIDNTPLSNKKQSIVEDMSEGQVFLDFVKKPDSNKIDNISDMFPKMKAFEGKAKTNVQSEQTNKSCLMEPKKMGVKNMDLFEEVKIVKEIEKAGIATKKSVSQGLFDDFEEEDLFRSKPSKPKTDNKTHSKEVQVKKKEIVNQSIKKGLTKPSTADIADDSEIIIKDRKIGEVSLFQEQDLGDHVLKEEEPLFLVSSSKKETKRNDLLFANNASPDEVKEILDENLDDLLNFEPLPLDTLESDHKMPPAQVTTSEKMPPAQVTTYEKMPPSQVTTSENEETKKEAPKPMPRPRKKSIETVEQSKPEVLPRKVFLDNAPPPVPSKPVLPPKPSKPKPPAKKPSLTAHKTSQQSTKSMEDSNANTSNEKPKLSNNQNTLPDLTDDLDKLDILKYIEQEEKSASAETSLFD